MYSKQKQQVLESQNQCRSGFFLGSQDLGNPSLVKSWVCYCINRSADCELICTRQFIIADPLVICKLDSHTEQQSGLPLCAFKSDSSPAHFLQQKQGVLAGTPLGIVVKLILHGLTNLTQEMLEAKYRSGTDTLL